LNPRPLLWYHIKGVFGCPPASHKSSNPASQVRSSFLYGAPNIRHRSTSLAGLAAHLSWAGLLGTEHSNQIWSGEDTTAAIWGTAGRTCCLGRRSGSWQTEKAGSRRQLEPWCEAAAGVGGEDPRGVRVAGRRRAACIGSVSVIVLVRGIERGRR
jgi:hypothetical protein